MANKKRIAAVTGAGQGIGRSIAIALANAGMSVAVSDIDESLAGKVADEIIALGGDALPLQLDVTRKVDAQAVVDAIVSRWGRLDIWCNNAGVSSMNRFFDLSEKDWDFNMDINAKGTFLCSQVAAMRMSAQDISPDNTLRGKIINTASMAGKRGNAPFLAHYVASKFAVIGLTQALAGELAERAITVNAVCPGYVNTTMQERELTWEASLRGMESDEVKRLYVDDTPLARLQTPEDVAGAVVFLASPSADFITGEAINVNGGAWMD
ncbi:MAG: SDR family oxidoreductase [Rhodospirillaceae bacterium]|nr:SDR family oxidoreductase [Rhodospirillaceae bacterium]